MKKRKKERAKKHSLKAGLAWYSSEQWPRLRQVSEDADQLEEEYEEWLNVASRKLAELQGQGLQIEKVDVDVNELLRFCNARGIPVNAKSRAEFATVEIRRRYEKHQ